MTEPAYTSAPVDCRPVIIAIPKLRLAGVQTDPYLQRAGRRPGLSRECSLNGQRRAGRVGRTREDGEAAISFAARLDVGPGMVPDGGLKQHVVDAESNAHH